MGRLVHAPLKNIADALEGMKYGDLEMDDVADILLRLTNELRDHQRALSARAEGVPSSDAHDAKCWREINEITHNDLGLAIEQAKRFAIAHDARGGPEGEKDDAL